MQTESNSAQLAILKAQVASYPTRPGVYLMKDAKAEVIYIGKAKNLRARVRSYFGKGDGRYQIEFLLKRVDAIETIVTESEEQAFVLENDLIKKYKPRYNIRLKDDKTYLSIRVDENHAWPRLELVRRVDHDGASYFGPYTFSYELRTVLDVIKKIVPLRTCSDTVFYNRQRPCLEYQIKRCAGPCCLPVEREQYMEWVRQAISILEGETKPIERELERLMEYASEDLRFEDAALYRDRIEILKSFGKGLQLVSARGENRDVFGLHRDEKLATLSVLQVRSGRIAENVNFSFREVEISNEEILESALTQFYEGSREIPEEIILPQELENITPIREILKERRGSALDIFVPKRGLKFRLLGLAELNAKEHYIAQFDAESRYMESAKSLAQILKLKQVPRRIECVDISNFQGSDIVGAMVVFFDGAPDKSSYKKYKISNQGKPDDFAAIREVVYRRLKRGMQEDNLPDLLVIDGGKGQLSMALAARDELEVDLEIVSIAKMRNAQGKGKRSEMKKKPERMFVESSQAPIILDARAASTHFMQRIRDEVHRYVISFHRRTRAKRTFQSILDEIPGVGPERKRRLLNRYGSVRKMKEISAEELAKAGRMPLKLAKKVHLAIQENIGEK